jgi:LysM repeat protein/peptidoglycan/xylan/chitin deacetylase (PgdA/CDA1 family)
VPGGLAAADVPQFVLISHDDAIGHLADGKVRAITDGHKNPNGCNVPATWFVTSTGTECNLAQKLLADNHEIALHTVSHAALSQSLGYPNLVDEIMGAKKDLTTRCGLPAEGIVGFRSPYLVHNPAVRDIISKNGLLYDSSMVEYTGNLSATSPTFAQRLWPYTMDFGIVQDCNWTTPAGTCTQQEKYPGLWEIPLWDLPNATAQPEKNAYTMDPDGGFGGDLFTLLQTNFDTAYNGNRAPFPLFVHAPWFTDARIKLANQFIEYALSKPDVYFVTFKQLIDWLNNPVPASQVGATLTCKAVDLSPPVQKKCRIYTVQAGDYFDKIAGKFGILNSTQLANLNPEITPTSIQPGQTMKIPPWDKTCGQGSTEGVPVAASAPAPAAAADPANDSASAPAPAAAADPANKSASAVMCPTITVEPNQTLTLISEATGASIDDLLAINNLLDANVGLQIGQVLKVPPHPECCSTNSCIVPVSTAPAEQSTADQPKDASNTPPAKITTTPKNALQMDITLKSAPSAVFQADGGLAELVASLLQVPVESVSVSSTNPNAARRRLARALLQGSSGPLSLVVIVTTEQPEDVYASAVLVAENGMLENELAIAGVQLQSMPSFTIWRNGIASRQPAVSEGQTSSANGQNASASGERLSAGAIAGIVVAGCLVAVIAVAAVVLLVKRRRRDIPAVGVQGSMKARRSPLVGGEAQLQVGGGAVKGTNLNAQFASAY